MTNASPPTPPESVGSGSPELDGRSDAELDALPFGVLQLDARGGLVFCNEAASRLLGRPAPDLVGRHLFRDVLPATHLPHFYGRYLEGVRRGRFDERFAFVLGLEPSPARFDVRMTASREPGCYWLALREVERLSPGRHREAAARAVDRRARAEPVDASVCEREPIHVPGSIQPQAVLLAAEPPGLLVTACSENVSDALGVGPADVLGRPLAALLPPDLAEAVGAALAAGALDAARPLRRDVRLGEAARAFLAAVHAHDGRVIVELELAPARPEDFGAARPGEVEAAVVRLREADTLLAAARIAADELRALTGFERVLVYRFDPDWNGEAIAESRVETWNEALLGLYFPASDIPAQARALYTRSHARFVVDRDYVPVPLVASPEAGNRPIDIGFAGSRSLSPVHLEYQRNLGVNGSMSASVMVEGRLWGLAIGHHRRPHYLPPDTRSAATTLAHAFALRVHELESRRLWRAQQEHLAVQTALLRQLAGADQFVAALTEGERTLLDLFGATGAAIVGDDGAVTVGRTPPASDVVRLAAWLRSDRAGAGDGSTVATDRLPELHPPAEAYREVASGLLAAFVNRERRRMLLWFRPEVPSTVAWGGDPRKSVVADAGTATVLPRRSFERWVEERRGRSEPWEPWQVAIAGTLAEAIEGVVLRQSRRIAELTTKQDELVAALLDKERLLDEKDLLTREIDHRVKNSLQIVAAFLLLQKKTVADPAAQAAFAETYGRVMSVARVHDSLYQAEDVEQVDLGQTIENLCEDLAGVGGDRRAIELKAEAGVRVPYKTGVALSLVATELVTNAFKYAYAPEEEGAVRVTVEHEPGGGVRLSVCDRGRGLPPDWADRPRKGLGMQLVRTMLSQIDAKLEVDTTHGACFTVRAA